MSQLSDAFYLEMAEVSSELLEEFDQGVLRLARYTRSAADSSRPWDFTIAGPFYTDLNGVVKRVSQRFVDGTSVVNTDVECTFAPITGDEPSMTDKIEVRGVLHNPVRVIRIPESGPVVAWKIIARR